MISAELKQTDALVIVDMQKDFCPGGALPVGPCQPVVQTLNEWIAAADKSGCLIVFSRDWHPPNHVSFEAQGGPWPEHCVRETEGAQFHADLKMPPQSVVVNKGESPETDQYSPFQTGELTELLKAHAVSRLWVGGVALDVCVRATVLDALANNYEVHLIVDATAAVNEEDGRKAVEEMQSAGAILE